MINEIKITFIDNENNKYVERLAYNDRKDAQTVFKTIKLLADVENFNSYDEWIKVMEDVRKIIGGNLYKMLGY